MDKQLVAQRFGRQAASYDDVAMVQQLMQGRLLAQLQGAVSGSKRHRILEVGCGTGRMTQQLAAMFPNAEIVAVDISTEMIEVARSRCQHVEFVVCDAEHWIRETSFQFDLVTSSATVQWFDDPVGAVAAWRKLLVPHGEIRFAVFGEQTFHELRKSFVAAYDLQGQPVREHVMRFPSVDDWIRQFPKAEFEREQVTKDYPDVRSFLRTLQAAGTTYTADGRPLSRRTLANMTANYRGQFPSADGTGIDVTYELIWLAIGDR